MYPNERIVRVITANISLNTPGLNWFLRLTNVLPLKSSLSQKEPGKIIELSKAVLKGHKTRFTTLEVGTPVFLENGR